MKFNRTFAAIVAAAAFVSGSSAALAATRTIDVNIEANVAVDGLLVSPVAGWDNNTQLMSWDYARQTLTPINRQLTMRNTTGAIKASLVAPANLTYGANVIGLQVKVNGVTLSTTAAQVIAASDAATVRNVDFSINAVAPKSWVSGNYAGTVYLMFDGA